MCARSVIRAGIAAGAAALANGPAMATDQPAPPAALAVGSAPVSVGECASCAASHTGSCASCARAKAANRHAPYKCPVYPLSERRYIKQFGHPTIAPGSCFGYFKTQWTSWPEACPGWPVDPISQSIYAPRVPQPAPQPPEPATPPADKGAAPKDGGAAPTTPPTAPLPGTPKDGGVKPPTTPPGGTNPTPPTTPPKSGLNSTAPSIPVPAVPAAAIPAAPATSPVRY